VSTEQNPGRVRRDPLNAANTGEHYDEQGYPGLAGLEAIVNERKDPQIAASIPRWCHEVTTHDTHRWSESGHSYICPGVPLDDSQGPTAAYAARLTACKCGHQAIEHYDSHDFCTWTVAEPPECECEKFEAVGPEIYVQVGQPHV